MAKMNSRRNFITGLLAGSCGLPFGLNSCNVAERGFSHEKLPIINDVDICVLGGSCTGVFAAVRAARLGCRVAIVEKQNAFGGVATNALVNT